jgi:uncharacterized LabA/DUF88 family protein
MSDDIALFIDFENIRYSMLNIQRREPDPQELISVARRYGTVMVARAYADWTRQPEPFKGSLMAAMIDRIDCPAKQRDRIRMGTIHYPSSNAAGGPYVAEQGSTAAFRPWSNSVTGNSGPLPAIGQGSIGNVWPSAEPETDQEIDMLPEEEVAEEETYLPDYQSREPYRQPYYQNSYGQSNTGPLAYGSAREHSGNTGHFPAVSGGNTIVQSTVVQSTVDLNMLMDIIETVFDRPTISTFVLMTGDKDFTRISARLKLRLNKTVIVVGIPGTVSRDLISSASQFVPLVLTGSLTGNTGALPSVGSPTSQLSSATGPMPAIGYGNGPAQYGPTYSNSPIVDVLDPQFLQFLDYIDRNWSWRTIIGVSNFIGDSMNPKNRFRGRLSRETARDLLAQCIQQNILTVHMDPTGTEDLRLNRSHPDVDEILKQFVR